MRLRLPIALLILATLACNLDLGGQSEPPTAVELEPTPLQLPTVPATTEPALPEPTTISEPTHTAQPSPTAAPASVEALPNPSGYSWRPVADGFQEPLAAVHANDDRLFVVEQRGLIWVLQNGQRLDSPLLDLRDRVNNSGFEQGLLGLAFHPQFSGNGFFYVNYTRAGGDTVIARFSAQPDANQADPGSEQVLMVIDQPFSNHNGGGMVFGPDGYLYIGTGDGGSAADPFGNGQSLDTVLGKLLRIDVDGGDPYGIPAGNPYASGGGRAEIWAYGLRNPWRFSFDSQTGDLYLGDVGQNAWEEIDFVPAGNPGGVNFGWNHREGMHPFGSNLTEGLTDPVAEYRNARGTCSVTGGEVVRDPNLPAWAGVYIYGDYCSGEVWGLVRDPGGAWQSEVLFNTGLRISSFGRGRDGGVYLVHQGGTIYQLEASP